MTGSWRSDGKKKGRVWAARAWRRTSRTAPGSKRVTFQAAASGARASATREAAPAGSQARCATASPTAGTLTIAPSLERDQRSAVSDQPDEEAELTVDC